MWKTFCARAETFMRPTCSALLMMMTPNILVRGKKVKITRILMNCIIVPFAILASQNPITLKRNESKFDCHSRIEIFSKFSTALFSHLFPYSLTIARQEWDRRDTTTEKKARTLSLKGQHEKCMENLNFHEQQFRWNFHFTFVGCVIFWTTASAKDMTWHE